MLVDTVLFAVPAVFDATWKCFEEDEMFTMDTIEVCKASLTLEYFMKEKGFKLGTASTLVNAIKLRYGAV